MEGVKYFTGLFVATTFVFSVRAQEKGGERNLPAPPPMGLIRDVGISADGRFAFAGDSNRTIWIWDVEKRKLVRAIPDRSGNRNTTPHYAFSADGKFAVVGNQNGYGNDLGGDPILEPETLTFWDLRAGKRLRSLDLRGEPVYAVALSPDGTRALSVSHYSTLTPPGKDLSTLKFGEIRCLFALRLWDTSNGKLVRTLLDGGNVGPIAFAPDGKFFADACVTPQAPLAKKQGWALGTWDTRTGNVQGAKQMVPEWSHMEIWCIALSPDGSTVAVAHNSGVSLWSVKTGQMTWSYTTHLARDGVRFDDWPVRSVAFSHDGKQVVASGGGAGFLNGRGCSRGGMVLIDVATGKNAPKFVGTKEWVSAVAFVPGGKLLLGGTQDGLRFWDARSGKSKYVLKH